MIAAFFGLICTTCVATRMLSERSQAIGPYICRWTDKALPPLVHQGYFFTVLILDRSGSMSNKDYLPNRMNAAKQAAIEYIRTRLRLSPNDQIAVVSFGTGATIEHIWTSVGEESSRVIRAIQQIKVDGSTSMGAGLAEAEALFFGRRVGLLDRLLGMKSVNSVTVTPKTLKRAIVLSDGGHNQSPAPRPIAARLRNAGVLIECIGIGSRNDVDENLLRDIASTVDGCERYRFIGEGSSEELVNQYRLLGGTLTR